MAMVTGMHPPPSTAHRLDALGSEYGIGEMLTRPAAEDADLEGLAQGNTMD